MAESSPLFGFDPSTTTVVGDYGKVAEAQGDIADAAAQSKSQPKPFDFLGIGRETANLAGMFAEKKNAVDAHQAKLRAVEFMQENDYLTGHELSAKIEEQIRTISDGDNYSSGYRRGALAVFDTGYAQALERKEEERVAAAMNVVASNYSTQVAENLANGTPMTETYAQEWASQMSAEFRLPIEYVRNSMMASVFQDAQVRVTTATTPAQLAAAQSYITNMMQTLRSPLFLDSRSRRFQPTINSLRSNLDSSISAKQTQFQQAAALSIVTDYEGQQTNAFDSYPNNPETPEALALLAQAYPNPATRARKLRDLTAGYQEAQEARTFLSSYDPMQVNPPLPSVSENKYILPAVEDMVYSQVVQNLQNPSRIVSIANNNPQTIGAAGDNIYHALMTTADEGQLNQMAGYLRNVGSIPGGARALQNMFGDNYRDVVGINAIASAFTGGNIARARDVIMEAKGALITPPLDPALSEDYYAIAADLGTLGDEFMYSVNTLLKVSPGLVTKDMLESLGESFAAGYEEREGVNYNVSRYDSANHALDPDVFNQQISSMATAFNGGVNPSEVTNLPGNIMVYRDEFGMVAGVFDATPTLQVTNALATAIASSDTKAINTWTRSKDTMNSLTSWLSDVVPNTFNRQYQLQRDQQLFNELGTIWSGENVDRSRLSEDILQFKAMFPEVISRTDYPNLTAAEREAMSVRNTEMQSLIDEVAQRFMGQSLENQIQTEDINEALKQGLYYDPMSQSYSEFPVSP